MEGRTAMMMTFILCINIIVVVRRRLLRDKISQHILCMYEHRT